MNQFACILSIGLLTTAATAQTCLNPNTGTAIGIAQDSVSAPQPIGFAFPFDGNTYTDIAVTDHGLIWLSNAGVPAAPANNDPYLYTPDAATLNQFGPVIAPFWSDTIPSANGDIFINSSATQCLITWQNMMNFGGAQTYTFQATLQSTGEIRVVYGPNVTNNSSSAGVQTNGVIGAAPGAGAAVPASIDFSSQPASIDATTYEAFLTPRSFDLAGDGFELLPIVPGYAVLGSDCGTIATFGDGCVSSYSSFYEEFADAALASTALTGQSLSLTNAGSGYVGIWNGTPAYVAPTAAATPLALNNDDEVLFTPSTPLNTPYGTFLHVTVHANAIISFGLQPIIFAGDPWIPVVSDFLQNGGIYCWHDFNPTEGGQVLTEEVGGVLYITWLDVESYPDLFANPSTLQFQLTLATGDITIAWHNLDNNTTSADGSSYLVGVTSPGSSLDPGATVLATNGPFVTAPDMPGLALDATPPALGVNWNITTSNIDFVSPIAITFFGTAPGPGLPLSAIGLNAPGCSIWLNTIISDITATNFGGTSTASIAIPNNPAFQGATLSGQSICLTLQNPANILTSNGILGTVGQ